MKKVFIIGILLVTLFPVTAFCTIYTGICGRVEAYPKVDSANLQWSLNTVTRTLTITGSGKMRDYDSDTPAPWHQYRNDFDMIWLSDSATSIGRYAFWDLLADTVHIGTAVEDVRARSMMSSCFKSLVFPTKTTNVSDSACYNCDHLKRVIFMDSVGSIGQYAFAYCDSLQNVNFGSSKVNIGYRSFYSCPLLTTISGTQVKNISTYAFYSDYALYNVALGDSLLSIGENAFGYCTSLPLFVVPAATNQIGTNPFVFCSSLDSLSVVEGNMRYDSRNNCNAIMETSSDFLLSGCVNTIIPTNCVHISDEAFQGCGRLVTIEIPNSVQTIGSSAFESCSSLQNVLLSDSVYEVGCYVFRSCNNLQSPVYNNKLFARLPIHYPGIYTMPDGIRQVTCGAFYGCDSLTSVILPQSLREINDYAFYSCQRLDTITIPSRVNLLGSYAFGYCSNLTRITLPDSIDLISSYLFYYCTQLRSIIIPDAVRSIGSYAFNNCRRLQYVTIPANLQTISTPFNGCDSLSSITWNAKDCHLSGVNSYSIDQILANRYYTNTPFYSVRQHVRIFEFGDSVRVVPRFLCYEMANLTSLSLPCNIDSIERCAFDYCNSVTSINWNPRHCNSPISYIYSPFYTIKDNVTQFTFGDSVRDIPAYLCHGMSNLQQLHIPTLVQNIGPYAFRYLNQLDTIWVDTTNSHYDSRNHCNALMNTSGDSLIVGCWKTDIPTDTRSIAPYAFRNVRRLTKVVVPEGVSYIGEEAFNGCRDLESVTLPSHLTAIHDYTFQDCDSLRYLRLPDSLNSIGLRAFSNCYKLLTLTFSEALTEMGDYAFSNCMGLLDIYCNPSVPPSITNNTFAGSSCPIYVPCPDLDTYRIAPIWTNISSRINGQYYLTFDARPNDYSYGDIIIVQEPNCVNSAIVEARPVPGYRFIEWVNQRGETMSSNRIFEFVPDENIVLTGVFQHRDDDVYDITIIAQPDDETHGSTRIVVQPDFDILATIDATPEPGYIFVAWIRDDGDTITYQNTYSFDPHTIYNDDRDTVVVIATFKKKQGIDNAETSQPLKVWSDSRTVFVTIPDNDTYDLYSINGVREDSARGSAGETLRLHVSTSGIYIVKSRHHCVKIIVK